MSLKFIIGRAGMGKTTNCLAQIQQELIARPQGNSLILLVPEQGTFQMETALATLPELGGTMRARVFSFRRLAWTVLREAGGASRPHLREIGKRMVLQGLLEQNREQLKVFQQAARHPNFADHLASAIAELKRYCLTPARLTELAKAFSAGTSNLLPDKLNDLALLYAELEKFLKNRFTDPDDYLPLLAERLPHAASLREGEVWVDGFSGFTPQEYQVLASLLTISKRVHVALCLDPADLANPVEETELFYQTHTTYRDLLDLAAQVGAAVEKPRLLQGEAGQTIDKGQGPRHRFSQNPALAHLEQAFFCWPRRPFLAETTPIKLVAAHNRQAEVEGVARQIVALARDRGYRWREISVLTRDLNLYEELLEQVFTDYAIPVFIDYKRPVKHHPLVELMRSALETVSSGWAAAPVFRYLKTDLVPISREEADLLENYVLAHGIKGGRWIDGKPWTYRRQPGIGENSAGLGSAPKVLSAAALESPPETFPDSSPAPAQISLPGASPESQPAPFLGSPTTVSPGTSSETFPVEILESPESELEEINRSRERAIRDLAEFSEAIAASSSFRGISTALYDLLNRLGVKETLEEWAKEAQANQQLVRAREYAQIYNQVLTLLDEMVEAMGDQAATAEGYLKVLEAGLENLRLGLIPPGLDQVFVGSLDRSRHSEVRANFLLGVNDGILPARPIGEGLLTNPEREELSSRGLKLAPDAKRCLFDEQYLIYLGLTRAREYLGISYALADQQGNALNPSLLIKELQAILPGLKTQESPLEPNGSAADLDYIASPRRALTYLAVKLREAKAGILINDSWRDVYNILVPGTSRSDADAGQPSTKDCSAEPLPDPFAEGLPADESSLAESRASPCAGLPVLNQAHALPSLNPVGGLPVALAGLFYENQESPLQPETRRRLYGTRLRAGVTQLEQFQACPFAHFLKYGLRLRERETWQLRPLDLGQFFHAALKIFVERIEKAPRQGQSPIPKYGQEHKPNQKSAPDHGQSREYGPGPVPDPALDWRTMTVERCNQLVEEIIEELLPELQNELLLSSKRAQYLGQKLQQVVQRSAWAIVEQFRGSSFRPLGLEVGFGFPEELPGLRIPLGDVFVSSASSSSTLPAQSAPYSPPAAAALEMVGRIDRLDGARSAAGTFLRVIDYKSGAVGLDLNELYYGLRLQLLTYLEVALSNAARLTAGSRETAQHRETGRHLETAQNQEIAGSLEKGRRPETAQHQGIAEPGGMLYFRMQNPVLSTKSRLSTEEIDREVRKRFRMKGLVLNDLDLIGLMENGLKGDSLTLPVGLLKGGGLSSRSTVADREQFTVLRQYLRQILQDLGRKILTGVVDIQPYRLKKQRACTYCPLKPVCQFDLATGSQYRVLRPQDKSALWQMFKEGVPNGEQN